MNLLKRISLVFLISILILVIISLFLPSTFYLEREVVIDADKGQVFNQVDELKNWENWSPWSYKDPLIYINNDSFSDPSFGEGASFIWVSEHDGVGSGSMEILKSIKDEYIRNNVDFGMGDVVSEWNFKDVEGGVEVVWNIEIDFGFNPFSKFFGLFLEEQVGVDYELGLNRLKVFCEELPRIHKVEVAESLLEGDLWFLSIRDTVTQMEMNNVHGKSYSEINQYMNEFDIVTDLPLMVIYHYWSDDKVDIEVGVPITDTTIVGSNRVKLNRIRRTNTVFATHYGPYDRLPETYFGINEYMRKNKVVVTGPPWESYVTDPASEPNPEKWKTVIYFPIE